MDFSSLEALTDIQISDLYQDIALEENDNTMAGIYGCGRTPCGEYFCGYFSAGNCGCSLNSNCYGLCGTFNLASELMCRCKRSGVTWINMSSC